MDDGIFDEELLGEFNQEALEGLDEAELLVVKMDSSQGFVDNFQSLFRVFHTLKGGAGMFQLHELQKVVHHLESLMEQWREMTHFEQHFIDYLLAGVDASRRLIAGEKVEFSLIDPSVSSSDEIVSSHSVKPVGNEKKEVRSSSTPPRPTQIKESIFVIDDEDEVREIIGDLFGDENLHVETFCDAVEALKSLENRSIKDYPVCIVSDIQMKKMDGIEFLKSLRGQSIDIPVVLISGYLNKERCIKGLEYGAFGFLEKPFEFTELKTMVGNAIDRVRLTHLVKKSIHFVLYQYGDVAKALETSKSPHLKELLESEVLTLLGHFKKLSKNI